MGIRRSRSVIGNYDAANGLESAAGTSRLSGQPTPVHVAVIDVLNDLMAMAEGGTEDGTPAPLQVRLLVQTLKRATPMMLDQFAKVPADTVVEFMTGFRDRIQAAIDAAQPVDDTIDTVAPAEEDAADDDAAEATFLDS